MNRDEQPQVDSVQSETSDTRAYDPQEVEPATVAVASAAILPDGSSLPPSVSPTPLSSQPEVPTEATPISPAPKSRRKWFLPVIIAAVLVVLGSSGVLAYKFWYQNPQKVISDGLMNAIEAKSMTYKVMAERKGSANTMTIEVNGVSKDGANSAEAAVTITADGKSYTVKGAVVVDKKSDIYVKVANVDSLLADFEAQMPISARTIVNDFVKKINDQWIVISNDRVKTFSEAYAKMQKCTQSAVDKIQSDKNYSSEIVDLYKKHPFLKITKELGAKDGNLGYEIRNDIAARKAFGEGFKNTKAYKMLHDCDNSFTVDTSDSSETAYTTTAQIWVSRWSHEITKITTSGKDNEDTMNLSFEPVFNKAGDVATPKSAKSVDEFMNDIQQLETALLQASIESQSATQSSDLFSTGA